MSRIGALLLLAALLGSARGEDASDGGATRSPGDMSVEERAEMTSAANGYDACVYAEAIARVNTEDDIRRVADAAMGHCQPLLDDLRATIAAWGFHEAFAEGFVRTVRQRAAHGIMPELAVRKGR